MPGDIAEAVQLNELQERLPRVPPGRASLCKSSSKLRLAGGKWPEFVGYGLAVLVAWLSASTSASSKLKVSAPAFCVAWPAFLAPGMGSTPCWISHHRATWLGLLSWPAPISRSNSTTRVAAARLLPRK